MRMLVDPARSRDSRASGGDAARRPVTRLGALLLASGALAGCDDRPRQWDAFVYPDRNNLAVSEKIAGFKTFELCQEAAINRLRSQPDPDAGDYECGYRCGPDPRYGGLNVCEETRK